MSREDGIVAGIINGKTVQEIRASTGMAESTIKYIAAKYSLAITSRYVRVRRPQGYWRKVRHQLWGLDQAEREKPRATPASTAEELRLRGSASSLRW